MVKAQTWNDLKLMWVIGTQCGFIIPLIISGQISGFLHPLLTMDYVSWSFSSGGSTKQLRRERPKNTFIWELFKKGQDWEGEGVFVCAETYMQLLRSDCNNGRTHYGKLYIQNIEKKNILRNSFCGKYKYICKCAVFEKYLDLNWYTF